MLTRAIKSPSCADVADTTTTAVTFATTISGWALAADKVVTMGATTVSSATCSEKSPTTVPAAAMGAWHTL